MKFCSCWLPFLSRDTIFWTSLTTSFPISHMSYPFRKQNKESASNAFHCELVFGRGKKKKQHEKDLSYCFANVLRKLRFH